MKLILKVLWIKGRMFFLRKTFSSVVLNNETLGPILQKMGQLKQTERKNHVNITSKEAEKIKNSLLTIGVNVKNVLRFKKVGSICDVYFLTMRDEKKLCFKLYRDVKNEITADLDDLLTLGSWYSRKKNFAFDSITYGLLLKSQILDALNPKLEAEKTNLFHDSFPELSIPRAQVTPFGILLDQFRFIPAIGFQTDEKNDLTLRMVADLFHFTQDSMLGLGCFHSDLNFENWGWDTDNNRTCIIDFGETQTLPKNFSAFIADLSRGKCDSSSLGFDFHQSEIKHLEESICKIIFSPFLHRERAFNMSAWEMETELKSLLQDDYFKLRGLCPPWMIFYIRTFYYMKEFCRRHGIKEIPLKEHTRQFNPSKATRPEERSIEVILKRQGIEVVHVYLPLAAKDHLDTYVTTEVFEKIRPKLKDMDWSNSQILLDEQTHQKHLLIRIT